MTTLAVRDRDRPIDGRTPGCPRCRGDAATWWSCVSMACRDLDVAGAPRRPARARHRHLPRRRGRAAASTAARRSGDRFLPPRWSVALSAWTSSVARSRPVDWRAVPRSPPSDPERIVVSSHDFDGCLPISSRGRARCAATGAGTIKVAVSVAQPQPDAPSQDDREGWRRGRDRHGRGGVPSRLLAARFGSRMDVCGRRRRARTDACAPDDRRLRVRRVEPDRRASSASSAPTRCTRCRR